MGKCTALFISVGLPAQNEGLLAINPDSDHAAILLVVVVACCSYPSPDESAVGEERTEPCQEERTCQREAGDKLTVCSNALSENTGITLWKSVNYHVIVFIS